MGGGAGGARMLLRLPFLLLAPLLVPTVLLLLCPFSAALLSLLHLVRFLFPISLLLTLSFPSSLPFFLSLAIADRFLFSHCLSSSRSIFGFVGVSLCVCVLCLGESL